MRRGIEATVFFNAPARFALSHVTAFRTRRLNAFSPSHPVGRAHVTGRKVHRTSPLKILFDAEAKVLGPRKGNRGGAARQNGRAAPA